MIARSDICKSMIDQYNIEFTTPKGVVALINEMQYHYDTNFVIYKKIKTAKNAEASEESPNNLVCKPVETARNNVHVYRRRYGTYIIGLRCARG